MALKREKKEQILKTIKEASDSSSSLVFFDYQNISAGTLNMLRDKLFDKKASFSVFKNTLLKKVLGDKMPELAGPTAVLFAGDDPVSPIKELYNFKKEQESIDIKFGILEGKIIPQSQVDVLAALPSKQELLAKVVGGMSRPTNSFTRVLGGVLDGFARVVYQISQSSKIK
ncbi:MAG: 50S ribosomal protein L10 [Patescibacteria group bacterium]|nr:50S ribosomal protein L10 [Patescibacteria group bacterium]